ncbi:hypothetical protein O0L34_g12191 [Tuta absoluta]|nr:hypothetical protein O0L34_g12191 [Tuta absoluta]
MATGGDLVALGDLLNEQAQTEQDNEILDRLKLLAQENLPEGWQDWKVLRASKAEVVGGHVDPQLLNKLRFAFPTVELARAFDPETDRLSEKGFRQIKLKLLDWDFARALVMGPPALANRIRGSAAQTEIFNKAVGALKPLLVSRVEADRLLSGREESEEEEKSERRDKRSCSASSDRSVKRTKLEERVERQMKEMFSVMLEKIDQKLERKEKDPEPYQSDEHESYYEEDREEEQFYSDSEDVEDNWRAPAMGFEPIDERASLEWGFQPQVKEAVPLIPEPDSQVKIEGMKCQKFEERGWNRIRYKEVEKELQASPVFYSLKTNTELAGTKSYPPPALQKQDAILGTITHGLLIERRRLAEELKKVATAHPEAAEDLRKVINSSSFQAASDNIMQYVCGHRAETIELRRKAFRAKNELLNSALHQIPPSGSHLFQEKEFTEFVKNNGGVSQIFPSARWTDKKQTFRRPTQTPPSTSRIARPRSSSGRGRFSTQNQQSRGSSRPSSHTSHIRRQGSQRGKDNANRNQRSTKQRR